MFLACVLVARPCFAVSPWRVVILFRIESSISRYRAANLLLRLARRRNFKPLSSVSSSAPGGSSRRRNLTSSMVRRNSKTPMALKTSKCV